ncbi:hypothetical protein [Neomegalonema perideroedes]|uniref:hypothetical protein n=1 Tax=Neomegalonema perideroedes TaxID=217219 RepID=UPI000373A2A3|nr:hypothetical protein [Neomegalonema perideroedes]
MDPMTFWSDLCLRSARVSALAGEVIARRVAYLAPGAADPFDQMAEAFQMTMEKPAAFLESCARMSFAPTEMAVAEAFAPIERCVQANAHRLRGGGFPGF